MQRQRTESSRRNQKNGSKAIFDKTTDHFTFANHELIHSGITIYIKHTFK